MILNHNPEEPQERFKAANRAAGTIYMKYGAFTTTASVIATCAVINAVCD